MLSPLHILIPSWYHLFIFPRDPRCSSFTFVPFIDPGNPSISPLRILFAPSCILCCPLTLAAPFLRDPIVSSFVIVPSLYSRNHGILPSHFMFTLMHSVLTSSPSAPFISTLNLSSSSLALVPFVSPVILYFTPSFFLPSCISFFPLALSAPLNPPLNFCFSSLALSFILPVVLHFTLHFSPLMEVYVSQ